MGVSVRVSSVGWCIAIPEYYNRVNPDLLRLMPPDAQFVLEIGCGAGALAEAYHRINPDVQYLAVEEMPDAALSAAQSGRVHRIFTGDAALVRAEDLGLSETAPSVDCLVFGDVLEHMVDPWIVLTKLSHWVKPGGQVLACIPNIQHYSVLVDLLRRNWEYKDQGLLDRTHLRFFTLEGIRQLFRRAELQIFDIQSRWWNDQAFDQFQRIMTPILNPLGINPAAFAAQTRALQYIVRAIRAPAPPQCTVLWSLLGSTIGSHPRIREPN